MKLPREHRFFKTLAPWLTVLDIHYFADAYSHTASPIDLQKFLGESVTRFFASGFFHESVSPQPKSIPIDRCIFFRKFAKKSASQGAPPVSTIPAANLPPVSAMPVANCHRYQQHQSQICHRCQGHRWQIMGTISGCRHL
jgi:hypothetical protein